MQTQTSDDSDRNNEEYSLQYRRAVSVDPRMQSKNEQISSEMYVNQMSEEEPNKRLTESRNCSLRRHVSEPARNKFSVLKDNIVTRTESLRSMFKKNTAEFFGVDNEKESKDELWRQRRMRLLSNYGKVRTKERLLKAPKVPPISIQTTGFDEIDGVLPSNTITGFSETVPSYDPYNISRLSSDLSRESVYKLTLKAISTASTAFKRKMSNRLSSINEDRVISEQRVDEQRVEPISRDWSESLAASDSVFLADMTDDTDDFFTKPITQQYEEVDSNVRQTLGGWTMQRQKSVDAVKKIPDNILQTFKAVDNSNRRKYGMGCVGRLLDRRLKKDLTKQELKAIDHIDDHRPYFTYWVTTVQIVVLVISLYAYGFGHLGFSNIRHTALVFVNSLSLQQVDYLEPQNFWGGPRAADLIHLGAKFTPCMRKDERVFEIINEQREKERNTGCCIRNDGSGCVQAFEHNCSPLLSTWHNWNVSKSGPPVSTAIVSHRLSGPVCGQDPRYCEHPASSEPYQWPDDITKWPICRKKGENSNEKHMTCELIGRPCCIGIYGQCHITTREYCDFVKGFFHEDATLCSQVSCMENICGMIPFYSKDSPNQFYRVWMPIFLHAGLGHLLITVIFQYFIMRDIERLTGVTRVAIIYLVSGIGGYLASAIFVPFRAEVGPAGSQFGLLACLFVEVINSWQFFESPLNALLKLCAIAFGLFLIGILPWIDNYAHITGFIIGFLLSLALLPYLTLKNYTQKRKIMQIAVCLSTVSIIIISFFIILYVFPIYDCSICKYINCIPFTTNWCSNQDIQVHRVDIL